MSDSNSQKEVDLNTDDLDEFSSLLFGDAKVKTEDASDATEDEEQVVEDNDETEIEDEDALATEDEEVEDEPEAEELPKEKPKNRFQERIDELTKDRYEEKRRADALEAKLNEVIAQLNNKKEQDAPAKPAAKQEVFDGPRPDEKTTDGEDKYPLGEFDPAYVRDIAVYSVRQELKQKEQADALARQQAEAERYKTELETTWAKKLETSAEKYPDILEKNKALAPIFEDLAPEYTDYLASTIMSMEYGPDVLYYLASNTDEAKKITESGAARATVALGRLEARFALQAEEKQEKKLKVSKAPQPPERLNKGNMVSKDIADDTDDLDAFAAKLFTNKRKW